MGDDTRSFLATVRSLGRAGIEVHAAPANFRSPALRSRYIAAVHDIPPWIGDGKKWFGAMDALLRASRFDLVIPCDETSLLPLQFHRDRLAPLARLAIPDDEAIAVLFDKYATRELAKRVGVPVAAGRLVRPDDTAAALLEEFGGTLVVKPRRSYGLQTLATRGKARVVGDPVVLAKTMNEAAPEETLLEAYFPGQGVGVSVLASRGRLLQCFEHHRVRESQGASFYRVSAPLTAPLVRACEAIAAALSYTGLAMVEFKCNAQGGWILLEVNARPWGSLPLPVALGVDFPFRWYRLLTEGCETPAVPYRTGVYGRNLVGDLFASRRDLASRRPALLTKGASIARHGIELMRPLIGREVHDALVPDDPRPGLAELWELAAMSWKRARRSVPGLGDWRRRRAVRQVAEILGRGEAGVRIVFVCLGNLCRSPFAEALMRLQFEGSGVLEAGSAGTMPHCGRSSPPVALAAAASFGIDLSDHRSMWLSHEIAEAASLIIVFDEGNRKAVFDRYPKLRTPVLRLDELSRPGEIADPIGGGSEAFQECYGKIAAGVAVLAKLMNGFARERGDVKGLSEVAS